MRAPIAVALFGLALALLASPASAQTDPVVTITVDTSSVDLGVADEPVTLTWIVTNDGPTSGDVRVSFTRPAGWILKLEGDATLTRTFTLASQAERDLTGTISIDPTASTPADGTIVATARITDDAAELPGRSDEMDARTQAKFIPAVPAPIPPPPPPKSILPAVWTVSSAFGLVCVAGYVLQARQVELTIQHPKQRLNVGADTVYRVEVHNPSRRAQNVHLRVRGVPYSWGAALSYPRLKLEGDERITVPLCLKVPFTAMHGNAEFRVEARPNRWSPWIVHKRVRVDVVDLKPIRDDPQAAT